MGIQIVIFILSLGALCVGADLFLSAAERIGKALGFSPLVVGFILVGTGTGLPELFVSHEAALKGLPNIALGNLVGSNISNLLLIMGVTALLIPMNLAGKDRGHQLLLHGILIGLVGLIFAFGRLNVWSSSPLLCFYVYFLYHLYHQLKGEQKEPKAEKGQKPLDILSLVKFVVGLAFLFLGGEFLVQSISKIASILGIGEYVIAVVFVALGTSLPEFVTAVSAFRRENAADLILGNIIGSNIFNMAVVGTLGIYDISLQNKAAFELGLLIGVSLFLITLSMCKKPFDRKWGLGFLLLYGGIVVYWLGLT